MMMVQVIFPLVVAVIASSVTAFCPLQRGSSNRPQRPRTTTTRTVILRSSTTDDENNNDDDDMIVNCHVHLMTEKALPPAWPGPLLGWMGRHNATRWVATHVVPYLDALSATTTRWSGIRQLPPDRDPG